MWLPSKSELAGRWQTEASERQLAQDPVEHAKSFLMDGQLIDNVSVILNREKGRQMQVGSNPAGKVIYKMHLICRRVDGGDFAVNRLQFGLHRSTK